MSPISPEAVVGTSVTFSFILLGNAITQSFMSVPAVLLDFPKPGTPEHAARAQLLGRQWPVFHRIGNNFMRPMSMFGIFGYGFTAWAMSQGRLKGDWRLLAVSSLCHLIVVIHSAINLQPLNYKIEACADGKSEKIDLAQAEEFGRSWIRCNFVRVVCPLVAGSLALWQFL
ncbi:uncharacterized protein K452DRAFT_290539 [Aplosporella prunicola CBS 121167]|uniref:DUF1772 domain-containing protein n=1 Tax=Aplosporella prunicola CBS 121167 TaxID=1176127 RepID=A0A6A6B6N9_9PEZI|nr:uncharacterized protein K452DRAFT_290539 [Aplosporella prunicola CBS 121167]KAF2138894.1 hypothetical protein K452DRAFT_290539 [Aplosporella prunicola CBS 121167]